ncbi:MAG: threonine synthase [Clostridia bacterium]
MKNVRHLLCINCGKTFQPTPGLYTCDVCGPKLGILDVIYDYAYIKASYNKKWFAENKDKSIWRYEPFLPLEENGPKPKLRVGWSPLYKTAALAKEIGLDTLYMKDDGQNPTASMKDRASAIAVAKALEEGAEVIACSSTGNAASSVAGNGASVGMKTVIFVPGRAPQGKVAQLRIFGAQVISVQGSYEDTFKLSAQAIEKYGWYNRNAAVNPYLVEGKKTITIETCEQMDWQVPDWIVFSVGDGCSIAGAWKGFKDLYDAGFIDKLPKVAGIQAAGCCPLYKCWNEGKGENWSPDEENTIADSIAVGVPRNAVKALRAINESNGVWEIATDEEILDAMRLLGRSSGIFGEPAGVTGLAGLRNLVKKGVIKANETVVCAVTGNGLKDVNNAIKAAGEPVKVDPNINIEDLSKILEA